jgi:hypothetical protein
MISKFRLLTGVAVLAMSCSINLSAADKAKSTSEGSDVTEKKHVVNLLPNDSLSKELSANWKIYGNVTLEDDAKLGTKVTVFDKTVAVKSFLIGKEFIPVAGDERYQMTVMAKGENIVKGDRGWFRLYVICRWYDKDKKAIPKIYPDLSIQTGTFDWKVFKKVHTAPANARYFKIHTIGLVGNSKGKAWLAKLSLTHLE